MNCPKPGCGGQVTTKPIDESTVKRVCQKCGHSEIVETSDAGTPGRRLLTDDMSPGGRPLCG